MFIVIIFWDIDGTLIENDSANVNLYASALNETLGVGQNIQIPHHGKVDRQIIHEYLTAAGSHKENYLTVKEKLEQLSTAHYLNPETARKPLPKVFNMLTLVEDLGHVNALFTGNSSHRSQVKLEGAGFNLDMFHWEYSFFG